MEDNDTIAPEDWNPQQDQAELERIEQRARFEREDDLADAELAALLEWQLARV